MRLMAGSPRPCVCDRRQLHGRRRRPATPIVNGTPDPIALLRAGDEAAVRELIAGRQSRAVVA
jgi:hypothetical protein